MKGTKYYLLFFLILLIIIDCKKKELPVIATNDVSSITKISAQCGGNITDDGGESIISRGVCWSTNTEPTIAENLTTDGTGTGTFTSEITGLTPNTSYQVRAYATNKYGIGYGDVKPFTTDQATIPIVTTSAVTSITQTTAISGGQISDDGAYPVTSRGVCWSTSQNPTISYSKTTDGSGIGDFTSSITELTRGTTYYVRAYATNNIGTAYGNEISFTTANPPILTTNTVSTVGRTFAICGGNITDDRGLAITVRGVCWSTSQNPTNESTSTKDGIGAGEFTSIITGLDAATTYYVKAYATTSGGTGYGDQVSFTTTITDDVADIIPTGLTFVETGISTAIDGSQLAYIDLAWDSIISPIFRNYHIQYKRTDYTYYTTTDVTSNFIRIESLIPNISYDFKIASVNEYGTMSPYSDVLTHITAADTVAPTTVTVTSALAGIQYVIVEWVHNTESDLASYNIYRNTVNDSGTSSLIGNVRTNYFVDGGLTGGQIYYYWIKAVDTSGNESVAYSTEVYATAREIVNTETDIGYQGWTQTCVFSSIDMETVAWTSGIFTSYAGTVYSISEGNTGKMDTRTYLYLDINTSSTQYQTTTVAANAVGTNKVMIGVAIPFNGPNYEATFSIFEDK